MSADAGWPALITKYVPNATRDEAAAIADDEKSEVVTQLVHCATQSAPAAFAE
jgi:hypothetical protein